MKLEITLMIYFPSDDVSLSEHFQLTERKLIMRIHGELINHFFKRRQRRLQVKIITMNTNDLQLWKINQAIPLR